MPHTYRAAQHEMVEWSFRSQRSYADPFNQVALDLEVSGPAGRTWRAPGFWAGGDTWRARFAAPELGTYTLRSVCSVVEDPGLHGWEARLDVESYRGPNPLLIHGPLRVAPSRRTLEHADGTPFFWLGDTWWMDLCERLKWPEEFQLLAADRAEKGFSVIQIVAGLYPDMPAFDPRGANEAGFPWEEGYARINPAYFDLADRRIGCLVDTGLAPCILACWGYYLPLLGVEKMKQHWRYLVARWGAYPVVWCLAGEAAMPYYLSEDKPRDRDLQIAGWTELARYLRAIDPYHHPVAIHPTQVGRDQVTDDSLLDLNMLQTGHGGEWSMKNTVAAITREVQRAPAMPTLVGEVSYEGFLHHTGADVQRFAFWVSILSGAAGHTYGANGIWQVNRPGQPYGPSPHGGTWGNLPWQDSIRLPGATQLGLARRLLERYAWQDFAPHPEWVEPAGSTERLAYPFAAGDENVRLVYFYGPNFPWAEPYRVRQLDPAARYRAFFWDPRSAEEIPIPAVTPDAEGAWSIPSQPELLDWVVVIERVV
jgi:hypothetical protein